MDQENPVDKYPRVTQAQLELWLADPVTIKYLHCLNLSAVDIEKYMSIGSYVHMTDPNITHTRAHAELGRKEGYLFASHPEHIFITCDMLEDKKEPEDEQN